MVLPTVNEYRPLFLKCDNRQIAEGLRIRLQGSSNMTLLPDFFLLDIYNISDNDLGALKVAKKITVVGGNDSVLCVGEIDDVYSHVENTNIITTVAISDGKSFWDTSAYVSLGAGATVETTIRTILKNASFGSYQASNVRFMRGQTVKGRIADEISNLARSVNARAYHTKGVVYVVEKGKAAQVVSIKDEDVINSDDYANGAKIIKVNPFGYPTGALIKFGGSNYRLASQKLNLDNYEGSWDCYLILASEKDISTDGMVGG